MARVYEYRPYLLERAIEEAKRKKLGAEWVIVGEGGVTQAGLPRRTGPLTGSAHGMGGLED
jgi:hypothetical protein